MTDEISARSGLGPATTKAGVADDRSLFLQGLAPHAKCSPGSHSQQPSVQPCMQRSPPLFSFLALAGACNHHPFR